MLVDGRQNTKVKKGKLINLGALWKDKGFNAHPVKDLERLCKHPARTVPRSMKRQWPRGLHTTVHWADPACALFLYSP